MDVENVSIKDNYWTLAPDIDDININICGERAVCKDTNPKCLGYDNLVPTKSQEEFCNPTLDNNGDCCVCNINKWSLTQNFIGKPGKTYKGYENLSNKNKINDRVKQNISNEYSIDKENIHDLEFKRVESGVIKNITNISDHGCFAPLKDINYYSFNDKQNISNYATYYPKFKTTLVRSNYGNNIEYIENYDKHRFFDSNDESLLNDKGYYEQCLYGNLDNTNNKIECPSNCNPDMKIDRDTINNTQPLCQRCPPNKGLLDNTCRVCGDINKIPHPRGYGCKKCPNNHVYDKEKSECRECEPNTSVLTTCENKGNLKCSNLDISYEPKDEFYSKCLNDEKCQISQHCINNVEAVQPPSLSPSDEDKVKKANLSPHYNLYMNEVCKTIDDKYKCDVVSECNWTNDKCLLKLPEDDKPAIIIPMAIPLNMADEDKYKKLNAFSAPTEKYSCIERVQSSSTNAFDTRDVSEF